MEKPKWEIVSTRLQVPEKRRLEAVVAEEGTNLCALLAELVRKKLGERFHGHPG